MALKGSGKYGKRAIAARANRKTALTWRLMGLTFTEVGERMGISAERAHQLVKAANHDEDVAYGESVQESRRLELQRLNKIYGMHLPHGADPHHAAILLKITEQRRAIMGLDAPIEMRVPAMEPRPPSQYDWSRLSTEKLRMLRAALQEASINGQAESLPLLQHDTDDEPGEES